MTTNITGTTTATDTSSATASKTSVDYEMFLKLLTTQMQNQDPLKPMDSTEYTSQLAQYSQLEQTVAQTDTLQDVLAQLMSQTMAQASGYIGKTGEFDYAVAGLSADKPATWNYAASGTAATIKAKISDASGTIVDTLTLDPTDANGTVTWDGMLAPGKQAPAGPYTLAITAATASGDDIKVRVGSVGSISEALTADGATTLGVNGVQIPVDKLVRLTESS